MGSNVLVPDLKEADSPVIISKKRTLDQLDEGLPSNSEVPLKIAKTSNSLSITSKHENANNPKSNIENKKCKGEKSAKSKVFKFGNYNRYYGYRNPERDEDKRLALMDLNWFNGKDVLDIGCNIGSITLDIAKKYFPNRIVGIDIDKNLIFNAKKNLKEFVEGAPHFARMVHFIHGNYVPDDDDSLANMTEEFDVILALSITKWIHLNFADAGMKRFFRKIFLQLKPGGLLILEPQPWSSYKKKRKLTEEIGKTYRSLRFLPQDFTAFLLSDEVGFCDCRPLGASNNQSKGFQRPMYLLKKPSKV